MLIMLICTLVAFQKERTFSQFILLLIWDSILGVIKLIRGSGVSIVWFVANTSVEPLNDCQASILTHDLFKQNNTVVHVVSQNERCHIDTFGQFSTNYKYSKLYKKIRYIKLTHFQM